MLKREYLFVLAACLGVILAPGLSPVAWAQGDDTAAVAPMEEADIPAGAEEEPWPSDFFKSLKFSGYLDTSYTYNFRQPKPPSEVQDVYGSENIGRFNDGESNEFTLNAFLLNISRPVNEDQWFGFTLTPFAGQDAEFTRASGLFDDTENFDLLNAYIEGYVPYTGATVKVGKWETTAGAEVIPAPYNDNFSRSFLFGAAIPFTHTGILVSQPVLKSGTTEEDMLVLGGGIANGWDNVDDENEAKAWLGFAEWTPCNYFEAGTTFIYSGSEQDDSNSAGRTLVDLVATVKPIPDLKISLNFDWGGEEDAPPTDSYAQWWGFSGIVRYDFALLEKEKKNWFVAVRGEYFDDADGSRTSANDDGTILGPNFAAFDNTGLQLWEVTFTLGYMPTENLLLRAEVRYDKASSDAFYDGKGTPAAAGSNTPDDSYQTTIALEAALLF